MNENREVTEERLTRFLCVRVSPSEDERIRAMVRSAGITRSGLVRSCLATGGLVYVGADVIEAIAASRADTARAGNLLKLIASQLQAVAENPSLDAAQKKSLDETLDDLGSVWSDLRDCRLRMVESLAQLYDSIQRLNGGAR